MGGRAASKKPARTEAGKAEGVRERYSFPHPCFLEELTHGELEPSAGAVTLDVLVQREAVGEAQVAHGRTPAQFEADRLLQVAEGIGSLLGVDVVADVEERHEGDAHFRMERPDVFEVQEAHAVAADFVVVLGIARGKVFRVITTDGVDAADEEAVEYGDRLVGVFEHAADAATPMEDVVRVTEQGVERLQFTDRLEEVVVTADTAAAVFHRDAAHHTGRGTFARVGGVVGDAGAYDAREVLALVFLVGAGGRVGNVEQGVAVETVANGHRGVLANGMEEADGITDGLLLEVIPFFPDGVAVVAETEIGIVDARVDERQVQIRGLAGYETLQAERVAAAEQVALLDAAAHAELVEGRVAHAAHDGAGAVFLQVDAEIDLIVLVRGNDGGVGLGKVAEAVQALVGAAQLGAVELVPVGKA